MLIIFDLDDTLIDTSGSVTPFKLKKILEMVEQKQRLPKPLAEAVDELFRLNQERPSSQDAFREILERYGAKDLFEEALTLYTAPLPPDFSISTTPQAKAVTQALHQKGHRLAIVTGGKQTFQLEKLKKAGLELSLFSKIMIPEDSIKKPCYEALLKEFSELPSRTAVVGDRIPMDLQPARELGFRTVHMRWGRGLFWKRENWIDHSIRKLSELLDYF